ncbi:hypothetical protein H7J07_01320 [Mycobacterium koreense]|uniref:hypothetical protein n=1 Tax=Mycolicibacillus koreensis TaxID=1069220 RepID=UPI0021F37E8A|nr:hypothetical protein [Mycolicibacillus koreensis]MCV7246900.1 hypothetical protein [Mycolicibacillus koreensis]
MDGPAVTSRAAAHHRALDSTSSVLASQPLSHGDAQRLDNRIRLLTNTIADNVEKLYNLVEQAKAGQIHLVLGYRSWTDYVADALTVTTRLDRPQRRELVGYLSGEGMSQRVIADVVGADRKTVRSDLAQVGEIGPPDDEDDVDPQDICAGLEGLAADGLLHPDDAERFAPKPVEPVVTGRDGKHYPATPPAPVKPHRRPITKAFWCGKFDLQKVVYRLGRLVDDDRFSGNRETIASVNIADLTRYRDELNRVIDALGGDR